MKIQEKKYKDLNKPSLREDYLTPGVEIINPILNFCGLDMFDIDVCCTQENIPAERYFCGQLVDGLDQEWRGVCWLNPPYSKSEKWVKKAVKEVLKGAEVWAIIPARTETRYWQENILNNPHAFFVPLRKGICFLDPDTHEKMGMYKNPLAIVYFGKKAAEVCHAWNYNAPISAVAFLGETLKARVPA